MSGGNESQRASRERRRDALSGPTRQGREMAKFAGFALLRRNSRSIVSRGVQFVDLGRGTVEIAITGKHVVWLRSR